MLKMFCVSMIFFASFLSAAEQYVVTRVDVSLINSEGVAVKKLFKGAVVRASDYARDKDIFEISYDDQKLFASKKSFRVISSVLNEERKIKQSIEDLKVDMVDVEASIDSQEMKVSEIKSKILELEIWIEVQRDFSYSREFFIQKTKSSYAKIKKLKAEMTAAEKILEGYYKKKDRMNNIILSFEKSLETLQKKIQPVKIEKRL